MSRFIEDTIARAGLGPVSALRARGEVEAVRRLVTSLGTIDLLVLGAVADAVRARENGTIVRIHPAAALEVRWIGGANRSELDLLRDVAIARITGPIADPIGVDWGRHGLELAQVALGFGASALTGPITRKSGALIAAEDLRKVKGQGMVAASALKRNEIVALVVNAGRIAELVDEPEPGRFDARAQEVPHV